MICVVDYGVGNSGAIINMIRRAGFQAMASSDPVIISSAEKLILPGVGAFDFAVERLHNSGLWDVLNELVVSQGKPILGICLGIQLMALRSEEGEREGFGWVDANVRRFRKQKLKVPHMGWNTLSHQADWLASVDEDERFYFVHSYYVECNDPEDVLFTTDYGEKFVSGFKKNNMIGLQFHPEKSHKYGLSVLTRYCSE